MQHLCKTVVIGQSVIFLTLLSLGAAGPNSGCNAKEASGNYVKSIEIERTTSGAYSLLLDLVGGEKVAGDVESLELRIHQQSSKLPDIVIGFHQWSSKSEAVEVLPGGTIKFGANDHVNPFRSNAHLNLTVADTRLNFTVSVTVQEHQGQTHGPEELTCRCVANCQDNPIAHARHACTMTMIASNSTASTTTTSTGQMQAAFFEILVEPGDWCDPNDNHTRVCPNGTLCIHSVSQFHEVPQFPYSCVPLHKHKARTARHASRAKSRFWTTFRAVTPVAILVLCACVCAQQIRFPCQTEIVEGALSGNVYSKVVGKCDMDLDPVGCEGVEIVSREDEGQTHVFPDAPVDDADTSSDSDGHPVFSLRRRGLTMY